jgi:hypothetical protein
VNPVVDTEARRVPKKIQRTLSAEQVPFILAMVADDSARGSTICATQR